MPSSVELKEDSVTTLSTDDEESLPTEAPLEQQPSHLQLPSPDDDEDSRTSRERLAIATENERRLRQTLFQNSHTVWVAPLLLVLTWIVLNISLKKWRDDGSPPMQLTRPTAKKDSAKSSITVRVNDGYNPEGCYNQSGAIFTCDGNTLNQDQQLMNFGACRCKAVQVEGKNSIEFDCDGANNTKLVYPLNECMLAVDGGVDTVWDLMILYRA